MKQKRGMDKKWIIWMGLMALSSAVMADDVFFMSCAVCSGQASLLGTEPSKTSILTMPDDSSKPISANCLRSKDNIDCFFQNISGGTEEAFKKTSTSKGVDFYNSTSSPCMLTLNSKNHVAVFSLLNHIDISAGAAAITKICHCNYREQKQKKE